jgi:hypothetical protein
VTISLPVWLAAFTGFMALAGFYAISFLILSVLLPDKDRQDELEEFDGDEYEDLPAERTAEDLGFTGQLPRVTVWEDETELLPAAEPRSAVPEWIQVLYGGHQTVEEAVESMWTRAQALEVRQMTAPQARRARHKAGHAARKELTGPRTTTDRDRALEARYG